MDPFLLETGSNFFGNAKKADPFGHLDTFSIRSRVNSNAIKSFPKGADPLEQGLVDNIVNPLIQKIHNENFHVSQTSHRLQL